MWDAPVPRIAVQSESHVRLAEALVRSETHRGRNARPTGPVQMPALVLCGQAITVGIWLNLFRVLYLQDGD